MVHRTLERSRSTIGVRRKWYLALSVGFIVGLVALGSHTFPAFGASETVPAYSDEDVVSFFLFASGPAAAEHADVLEDLGTEALPEPKPAILESLTEALLAVDPEFHEDVTLAVQSGDPYKVEAAVEQLVADVSQLQRERAPRGVEATAAGKAQAATNFYVWAQVAVSAAVVVAVAAVVSVAVVLLALYQNPGDSSDLIRQHLASKISEAL